MDSEELEELKEAMIRDLAGALDSAYEYYVAVLLGEKKSGWETRPVPDSWKAVRRSDMPLPDVMAERLAPQVAQKLELGKKQGRLVGPVSWTYCNLPRAEVVLDRPYLPALSIECHASNDEVGYTGVKCFFAANSPVESTGQVGRGKELRWAFSCDEDKRKQEDIGGFLVDL